MCTNNIHHKTKSLQISTGDIYISNNYKLNLCKLTHIVICDNHRHDHQAFDDLKKIKICIIMHTNATIWGISCSLSFKVKYAILTPLVALNRDYKFRILLNTPFNRTKDNSTSVSFLIQLKCTQLTSNMIQQNFCN